MNASGRLTEQSLTALAIKAGKGDTEAAYTIHQHYYFTHDRARSIQWLRIAALQGNLKAQHAMFVFLSWDGDKAPKENLIEANWWLQKSADGGCQLAKDELARRSK